MKKLIFLQFILLVTLQGYSQRVGIGTTEPMARLSVDSSIMLDQSNANQGTLTSGALLFGSDGQAGISRSFLFGSSARNGLGFHTGGFVEWRWIL